MTTKVHSRMIRDADVLTTVGAGGDFSNVQEALAYLSTQRIAYENTGDFAELRLLSGFVWTEQIFVRNGADLSFIKLTSEDPEVTITRSAINTNPTAENLKPIWYGENSSQLPFIDVLFSYDTSGSPAGQSGVWVEAASTVNMSFGSGVKNCPGRGLHVSNASVCYARGTIWDGSDLGFRISNGSYCTLRNGSAQNCTLIGGSCESSVVVINELNTSGSFAGVRLQSCHCFAKFAISNNITSGINYEVIGGTLNLDDATLNNGANNAIRASSGAVVSFTNGTATTAAVEALYADEGSSISAVGCNISGAIGIAARATRCSKLVLTNANIDNHGVLGVIAQRGSQIDVTNATNTGGTGTGATVVTGAQIYADSFTGSLSQAANTVFAAGIIFQ